jgi:hypothetical protein
MADPKVVPKVLGWLHPFRLVSENGGYPPSCHLHDDDDQQCFFLGQTMSCIGNQGQLLFALTAMLAFLALFYYILKSLFSQPAEV